MFKNGETSLQIASLGFQSKTSYYNERKFSEYWNKIWIQWLGTSSNLCNRELCIYEFRCVTNNPIIIIIFIKLVI